MAQNKNTASLPPHMDYEALRKAGIEYIQSVSGKLWTDFNAHDPGVTFLEQLCFALVDLGFRTSFDIKDILTPKKENHVPMDGALVPAHRILQSNPTTIEDYRKLVLEHVFLCGPSKKSAYVRNIHLEPKNREVIFKGSKVSCSGFYAVKIETDERDWECRESLRREVWKLLVQHRNLNEMFEMPLIIEPLRIGIQANIEIERDASYREILLEIYKRLYTYVSPDIRYHSLNEMLESGKTVEEIYSGLTPSDGIRGFIDRDELAGFQSRTVLYISDVKSIILGIKGVKSIRSLSFKGHEELNRRFDDYPLIIDKFHLELKDKYIPTYCLGLSDFTFDEKDPNQIFLTINGLPFFVNSNIRLDTKAIRESLRGLEPSDKNTELPIPESRNRNTDVYHSFQNELPELYKLREGSLSKQDSQLRHAQRMQLKAYLGFFDQILSDYLAQLSSISDLLSWKSFSETVHNGILLTDGTYAHHKLTDEEVADISRVIDGYNGYNNDVESYEMAQARRSEILNHLLARFNEAFVDYSIFTFWQKNNLGFDLSQSIKGKKLFLKEFPLLSTFRSRPTVLGSREWIYSDLENRLMRKIGVLEAPKSLAASPSPNQGFSEAFGLRIIEHSLLIPTPSFKAQEESFLKLNDEDDEKSLVKDPYSFQTTVVLPGWLRFALDGNFRNIVERIIYEETPAHMSVKICWISYEVMKDLEDAYARYLWFYNLYPLEYNQEKYQALCDLIAVLDRLHNIYPDIHTQTPEESDADGSPEQNTPLDSGAVAPDDAPHDGCGKSEEKKGPGDIVHSSASSGGQLDGDILDAISGGQNLR